MGLTVKELRKKLIGLPPEMPVYLADHDHSEGEWNSSVGGVVVVNQEDLPQDEKDHLDKNPTWKIDKPYLVIHP